MHFNILTIFPEMFRLATSLPGHNLADSNESPIRFPGTLSGGVVGRAMENKVWSMDVINIRDFATDNYGSVDDAQFGGGAGMVMRADILANAIDSIPPENRGKIIYFSPRGVVWNQKLAREFATGSEMPVTLLCGRYEGIDQRLIEEYDIMEISIGDYILSGGELAAQVFVDSCVRLMDNVVHGGEDTTRNESFEIGGLEWPLYTRPSVWRGHKVPEVLLSGHHGNIEKWRREQSDAITMKRRPELLNADEKEKISAQKRKSKNGKHN